MSASLPYAAAWRLMQQCPLQPRERDPPMGRASRYGGPSLELTSLFLGLRVQMGQRAAGRPPDVRPEHHEAPRGIGVVDAIRCVDRDAGPGAEPRPEVRVRRPVIRAHGPERSDVVERDLLRSAGLLKSITSTPPMYHALT